MYKKLLVAAGICLFTHIIGGNIQEDYWTDTYIKATQNYWGDFESFSGPGSSKEQTRIICQVLPKLIEKFAIASIVDVPCGDFNWMNSVDLGDCAYIGCDIVKPMIDANIKKYGSNKRTFKHIDITKDFLPQADIIICRDLLVHFSIEDINLALKNFKRSGAKYLLTTTFTRTRSDLNSAIATGGWRTVNLQRAPFNFPAPIMLINEKCTEQNGAYNDKSLGLWLLDDINI